MQRLAVGVGVCGVHQAVFNAEGLMQNLSGRGQTVGGTTAVADHFVFCRVVIAVINAHHNSDVIIFGRCGNNDAFCSAPGDVNFRFGFFSKEAGSFNNDINAHRAPRNCSGIPF
ncbi:hypothetical protein SRABI106_04734 [Rahnella aquatilis]|nr:hypothetical protein SRABI106_04734 [Rahnella aquatilis]